MFSMSFYKINFIESIFNLLNILLILLGPLILKHQEKNQHRAYEVAQLVKLVASQAWQPEFHLQGPIEMWEEGNDFTKLSSDL